MVVRDYLCTDCGHTFEEFVFHESDKVVCPQCNSEKTVPNVSCASFKVKGSGAYDKRMKV